MKLLKEFLARSQDWLVTNGLKILLILIITLILLKLTSILANRISKLLSKNHRLDLEQKKRVDTLSSVIKHVITVIIITFAIITLLGQLGIEIGPILAAAGIAGLAVGFGAQSLVKDMINGFFILLEDQVRVGDVINVAGHGGLVEKVNLRMVILRDLSGNVHYIPNSEISTVTNMTKDYSRYVFDIGVAYRENVDEVIEVIKRVDESMREDDAFKFDILEPIEILGLDKFADSAVVIRARTKTKPIMQWKVGREFNRRLKIAFDENNIEIPFPHVTLYAGQDKDGTAPAYPVNLNGNAQTLKKDTDKSIELNKGDEMTSQTPDPEKD